jgi:hypothetical protein
MGNRKEWWQEMLNTKKKLRVKSEELRVKSEEFRVKSEEFRVEVIHLAVDLKQKTL